MATLSVRQILFIVITCAVMLMLTAVVLRSVSLPLFNSPYSRVLEDRHGELLGASLAADEQWRFPPALNVPYKFTQAIICYEDKRFFRHWGVDPLAVGRALWQNLQAGRVVSGASTLTMQVVRLSRPGKPRTLWPKTWEAVMALRLEMLLDKAQILALYAGHAPFGGNVVGLPAAAWRYFGRAPEYLSWSETALLAVLPNSPSLMHPGRNRARLEAKRNRLLERLHQRGLLDDLDLRLALAEPLPPRPFPIPMLAPHLMFRVAQLPVRDQRPLNGTGGIRTTLSKSLQTRATRIVKRHVSRLAGNGIHNAAALILEVESGAVLAYVGNDPAFGTAYHENYVDMITAPRSTGSILKPLLYAGMLQSGELLPTQLVRDTPTRMGGFRPQNYSREYHGAVPAFMALARSLNVPAVRMLQSYGVDRFYALLKALGLTTLHRSADAYGLSLILGGAEATLWDMTAIYAALARCVNRADTAAGMALNLSVPHYLSLRNPGTSSLASGQPFPLRAPACWATLQALLQVARPGVDSAWREFSSSHRVAWKTGTSYGHRDAWAVGVTPRYAVGVWVGNADGEGRPELTGLASAAPLMFALFGMLEHGAWFSRPQSGLARVVVCAQSGHRMGPHCARTREVWAPVAGLHSPPCSYCRLVHCDTTETFQVHGDCEPIHRIRTRKWFVLPAGMEWFYRKRHTDYRVPPPLRADCPVSLPDGPETALDLLYPEAGTRFYLPVELDGQREKVVFKAAHRRPSSTVYWHIDDHYLGYTRDIHQMSLAPEPGAHVVTVVDGLGNRVSRRFWVIGRQNAGDTEVR